MKTILCFIGAALYGFIESYILWLVFSYFTPWLMSWSWFAIIVYCVVATGLIGGLVTGFSALISIPLFKICKVSKACRYLPMLFLAFYGYKAVALPWQMSPHGIREIVIAISISLTAVALFVTLIITLWNYGKSSDDTDYD